MGLIMSVICSFLFCLERSMTWVLCCFFLVVVMVIAFVLGMYGITIGYHMAQKRMSARLEQRHVVDDTNYDKYTVSAKKSQLREEPKKVMLAHARRLDHLKDNFKYPSEETTGADNIRSTLPIQMSSRTMPVLGQDMDSQNRQFQRFPKARVHVRDVTSQYSREPDMQYLIKKQAERIVRRMMEYETSITTISYRKFPTAFKKSR